MDEWMDEQDWIYRTLSDKLGVQYTRFSSNWPCLVKILPRGQFIKNWAKIMTILFMIFGKIAKSLKTSFIFWFLPWKYNYWTSFSSKGLCFVKVLLKTSCWPSFWLKGYRFPPNICKSTNIEKMYIFSDINTPPYN